MRTTDLTKFEDDGFVLHFGGRTHEVDAFTFGNALVSFAEAIQSINNEINPDFKIEIAMDAVGPGSFRVNLKTAKKSLRNLFKDAPRNIIIALLATFLWEKVLDGDTTPRIIVNDDSVVMEVGEDRIIVPRDAYEARKAVNENSSVNRNVAKAIETIQADPSIEEFGISLGLKDVDPVLNLPRSVFPAILQNTVVLPEEESRYVDQDAALSIHKAVFERSRRKWEFIWNGFRISAPILDDDFFDRLEQRSIYIRQGDVFKATLRVHQIRDRMNGNWLNERYEIIRLGELIDQGPDQISFDMTGP